MTGLAALIAVVAALCYATAIAVQQRVAAAVPPSRSTGVRLMFVLVRTPLWWVGIAANALGFILQLVALDLGSLLLVQPLTLMSLVFALPLNAWLLRRQTRGVDLLAALALVAALAVFLSVGNPTGGAGRPPASAWLWPMIVVGVLVVACLVATSRLWGRMRPGLARAVALAFAAGALFGTDAAFKVPTVTVLSQNPIAIIGTWEFYGLVLTLLAGTVVQQSAYQAGPLAASLPAMKVAELLTGFVLGLVVLGESLSAHGGQWLVMAVAGVVMVAASIWLARPRVSDGAAGKPAHQRRSR